MSTLDHLLERHPYIDARQHFLDGRITTMQAAAMVARDPEWIAECDLRSRDPFEEAQRVVLDVWRHDLCAVIRARKAFGNDAACEAIAKLVGV